ncbi:MAG: DNA mismatch endonuclease Vsr [Paludibacteraceae bacterium]|nr:DNA mismatch endonuclease Vsr [Paludibacteraceae bacterium]
MDRVSAKQRSYNMSKVRASDTKPEKKIRSALFKKGYRFRLNGEVSKKNKINGTLPGKPDIVMAKHKTVIFVHGCFWHQHRESKRATLPKTNVLFWKEKLKKMF